MNKPLAVFALAAGLLLPGGIAHGHGTEKHGASTPSIAVKATPSAIQDRLPIDVDLRAALPLTDQFGARRNFESLTGSAIMLFFGYANCEGICLAALPLMAETEALLRHDGVAVKPVMITIDPARDTVDNLQDNLEKFSTAMIGLTGSGPELEQARRAFNIKASVMFENDDGGAVYKHGTFIYLLDPAGELVTVIPPVLSPESLADIVKNIPGP